MSDNDIKETEVLNRLSDIPVSDKGRDEREQDDGLYEVAWWEVPPEYYDELRDLAKYDNVSLGAKNPRNGPDLDNTLRLSVINCIRPVPSEEHERYIEEQYPEEMRERPYDPDAN